MSLRFAILKPCPKRWTDLHGDGRQKYCDDCRTSVHAIEQYSPEGWDQIWRESEGRLCGYLGGESPAEPRSRRAVLVGSLLTAISPLMAQNGRVRIRVTDANGAMVATAEVLLLGADDKPVQRVRANDGGEVAWTDLPMGDSRFAVEAPGFKRRPLTVTLSNGEEVHIEAVLEVGSSVGELVTVEESHPTPATASSPSKRSRRRRWLIFR